MKKKKFEQEWFLYVHGVNCNGFRKMNIFNHFRFEEDTIKHLKECSTKEEFAERISRELFYYFGSKCEYELIITRKDNKITLSPWTGNKEGIVNRKFEVPIWNFKRRYLKWSNSTTYENKGGK